MYDSPRRFDPILDDATGKTLVEIEDSFSVAYYTSAHIHIFV